MLIHLSYPIKENIPLYPGTPPVVFQEHLSIANGDSANTHLVTFQNHTGTHIDTPFHFCRDGLTVAGCLGPETVYTPAYCLDIRTTKGTAVTVEDLAFQIRGCENAEAILLRTGGYYVRKEDPERYRTDHPYVSPEVPAFLRAHCQRLRIFGLDQISVSSVSSRDEGRQCHREFLCKDPSILLLEDLDLSNTIIGKKPFRLRIYPHMIADIDGIPVTALAETDQ